MPYFERYISGIDLDASLTPYYPFPDKSSKHKTIYNPSLITNYIESLLIAVIPWESQ